MDNVVFESSGANNDGQTSKDGPINSPSSITEYVLRRLHPDADGGTLRSFLTQLTSVKENDHLSVNFSSLLKNTYAFSLRYTKQSPFDNQYPSAMYLFKSEIALIFYDWLTRQESLIENLTTVLKERNADEKASNALISIAKFCQNIGADEEVRVDESREKQFSQLLERSGSVSAIAKFILDYLDNPTKDEKEKEEEEKPASGGGAPAESEEPATSEPAAEESDQETSEGGDDESTEEKKEDVQQPVTPPEQPQKPVEPLTDQEVKTKQLFSSDVLRETARFTQISLIQLEKFHDLPEGTLQNSPELREQLTIKAQEFFAATLPKEQFEKVLSDPLERLKLIREFYSTVLHNSALQLEMARALQTAVTDAKDPKLKEKILAEVEKAKRGENASELISGLAENPEIAEVIKNIQAANPLFQNSPAVINDQLSKDLLQHLRDAGIHNDRIPLVYENIVSRLNAMADGGFDPRVLDHLSEQNYKLLFSEYAPINPELTEFLKEFIILKKAINSRTENSFVGKELFALQEAQRLLDESNTKISPQQSQQIFIRGVLKPTNEIITDKRALGLQSNQTFGEARSISDQWETNYRAYLQGLWNEFTTNQQQLESFQRFAQFEIAPLAVPQQEFVIYLQSAQAGADYPLFETGQERVLSPLAGMSDFSNKAQQFGQINRLAQGLGRGLLNRFGGKAAEKGVEEAVGKIAGGLAEKAGSTLPGGPITGKALGWLAKNATTKEGRKKILLVAGGGLGSILLPLATWGGRIGMAIGGGLGAVVGSIFPGVGNVVGGVIGGIGGGWAGMRISNGFKNLFGGGGGETASIGFQSPGIDSRTLTTGSAITSKGTSAAGSAVATAMTNTASQAVLTTLGVVGSVFLFTSMNFTGAFLAEFPQIDPLGTIVPGTQGKVSDYVTIEKRVFITGCPENKCKNPSFPIKAEYSIIIRPKANYGIAVSEVIDSLKVNHSKKAWEEEGKSPPDIPERIKGLDDISELYSGLVISPGEEFAFSYTETFDENYNHAIVLNTFELKFSFRDAATGEEGEDNAITGEVVYIGNYSQGAGCWPTSGSITQLPGGSWSHKSADAFDIANSEGTPVYAPFSGNLCVGGMDSAYGNHLILEAGEGRFLFGHFSRMIIGSGCQSIESGELIGNMGNTGRSTGPHLHFELLGGNIRPSSLGSLMPDGLATKENDPVRTCYDVN